MDLGDAAVPMPVQETKTLEYFINSAFGMHLNEPVIIVLDEYPKASDPIKNMLHPLLEVNEPRMGSVALPAGSIVVITGNLESDGVGDSLLAHTRMRLTMLEISKPTSEEWLAWASTADISPVVTAWATHYLHTPA
jgi:MoxR-like ATPase